MLVITTGAKGWWCRRWPGGGGCKNRLGTFDGEGEGVGTGETARMERGGGPVFRLR